MSEVIDFGNLWISMGVIKLRLKPTLMDIYGGTEELASCHGLIFTSFCRSRRKLENSVLLWEPEVWMKLRRAFPCKIGFKSREINGTGLIIRKQDMLTSPMNGDLQITF